MTRRGRLGGQKSCSQTLNHSFPVPTHLCDNGLRFSPDPRSKRSEGYRVGGSYLFPQDLASRQRRCGVRQTPVETSRRPTGQSRFFHYLRLTPRDRKGSEFPQGLLDNFLLRLKPLDRRFRLLISHISMHVGGSIWHRVRSIHLLERPSVACWPTTHQRRDSAQLPPCNQRNIAFR